QAVKLLDTLQTGDVSDSRQALVDATLARIGRSSRTVGELELCPDDQEALEALMGAGYDASRVPRILRSRAQLLARLMSLLDAPAPELAAVDIRQTTLARVQAAIEG